MAALAVVRLRGLGAEAFVRRHFDRPAQRGRCLYGNWREDDGEVLDDVVVVAGEGWVDVNMHGGPRLVAKLLEQAEAAGFRVITGEAAIDAAAADELDAWLPRATTETGLRLLLAQPEAWRRLDPQRADIKSMLADTTLRRMLVPATVAIVGAPNVGKSTLANALFGQERAIVADVPGTTRDWVGGMAELGGLPVVLIDTPGRRLTSDEIEREAIEISAEPVARADVVVELMDATEASSTASPEPRPRGQEKPWLASALSGLSGTAPLEPRRDAAEVTAPRLRVANKTDLAPAPEGWLAISAKTGDGLPELVAAIHRLLGVKVPGAHRDIPAFVWTDEQHRLLSDRGARAIEPIAHRIGRW